MKSHSLCRTCFGEYKASLAVVEWLGDGDYYLMHKMFNRSSTKALFLCVAVLHSNIAVIVIIVSRVVDVQSQFFTCLYFTSINLKYLYSNVSCIVHNNVCTWASNEWVGMVKLCFCTHTHTHTHTHLFPSFTTLNSIYHKIVILSTGAYFRN